jgi:PTS system glucitol/sorbitol-specific IIA component
MTSTHSGPDPDVVYRTTVTAVGEQVGAFLEEGLLILFAAESPVELHSISVLHVADVRRSGPVPGDVLSIGTTEIPVLAAGDVVRDNLLHLGHCDIKADGSRLPSLPGDVCVPPGSLVMPRIGDVISVRRPQDGQVGAT